MTLDIFHQLPTATLRALASSLREGMLSTALTHAAVQQITRGYAADVEKALQALRDQGMTPAQMAIMLQAIAGAMDSRPDPASLLDLVLSGPNLPGMPTSDTAAVVRTLISQARREVLAATYAIHDGAHLFEPLAQQVAGNPALRVTLVVHIGREFGDTSTDAEIVRRFASDFRAKHWPWPILPRVLFDPRGLLPAADKRASMHAKCVAIDRKVALITSANFTEAAQRRNVEAGVLVRHEPTARRLVEYFEGLYAEGKLMRCLLD